MKFNIKKFKSNSMFFVVSFLLLVVLSLLSLLIDKKGNYYEKKDLNDKDMDKYNSDIDLYGDELINEISDLYFNEMSILLKDLYKYMDNYSNARLDKIIKEIIFNHFIEKINM